MSRPLFVQASAVDSRGTIVWGTNVRVDEHDSFVEAIEAASAQLKDCTPVKYLVDYEADEYEDEDEV